MEPVDLLLRYPLFAQLGRDLVAAETSLGDYLATEMVLSHVRLPMK